MNKLDIVLKNITSCLEEKVGELSLLAAKIEGGGFSDIVNDLSSQENITRLGNGNFGVAFSGSSGDYVFKIARNDSVYHTFYQISLNNQSNPLFPKFISDVYRSWKAHNGDVIRTYGMERLKVEENNNVEFLKVLFPEDSDFRKNVWLVYGLQIIIDELWEAGVDSEEFREVTEKLDESITKNLVDYVNKVGDRLGVGGDSIFDVHKQNFGFRPNGELVIFDPVSALGSPI